MELHVPSTKNASVLVPQRKRAMHCNAAHGLNSCAVHAHAVQLGLSAALMPQPCMIATHLDRLSSTYSSDTVHTQRTRMRNIETGACAATDALPVCFNKCMANMHALLCTGRRCPRRCARRRRRLPPAAPLAPPCARPPRRPPPQHTACSARQAHLPRCCLGRPPQVPCAQARAAGGQQPRHRSIIHLHVGAVKPLHCKHCVR